MEVMLGISHSYPYVKLAKILCLSYYCLCLFNKIEEEGRTGSAWKQGGLGREGWGGRGQRGREEIAPTMYAHMNKFKKQVIFISFY
jgi:hypothetical protein